MGTISNTAREFLDSASDAVAARIRWTDRKQCLALCELGHLLAAASHFGRGIITHK